MAFTLIPYLIFLIVFLSREKEKKQEKGTLSYPFFKTYHIHMNIGLSNPIHTLNDSWLVIVFFVWDFYQKKILYISYSGPVLLSNIRNRLSSKKKKKKTSYIEQIIIQNFIGKFSWQQTITVSHEISCGKKLRNIATANSCDNFLQQIATENTFFSFFSIFDLASIQIYCF